MKKMTMSIKEEFDKILLAKWYFINFRIAISALFITLLFTFV